jgi:hypothetical protein
MMGYYRIVGIGTQASEPIEKIVATALEAESKRNALQRLCGKYGKVEVCGKDGRVIGPDRLRRMAHEEELAGGLNAGSARA